MGIAENILSLIPQSHPFVMIDELLYSDGELTRTGFRVCEDNIFVENGQFNEAGLIENMAQTAAAGAGYTACIEKRLVDIGYIGAVKNLEIFALPAVNDELITEATIQHKIFDSIVVAGNIWCNTKMIALCELKIFINKIS
jgi:predicted hotdog family 3-hydroxylacyl-ACP dehydratase